MGSTTQTYTYSGDGIRLTAATGAQATKTTQFVVDRAFPLPTAVLERDGSGRLVRRYIYGLDLLSQTTPTKGPYWYHHDGLGSVSDITSASGSPLWWAEYQPFGLVRASGSTSQAPVNPLLFTGQYQDSPTGLYYLRARQYDPGSGRFTAVDPVRPVISRPCVSAYAYARNTPVRFVDPSGRESQAAGNATQQASGFCATTVIASAAIFLSFSLLDTAISFVTFWAPEAHALPPVQALDLIAIGGTLGAVGGVVYGGTHRCEDTQ